MPSGPSAWDVGAAPVAVLALVELDAAALEVGLELVLALELPQAARAQPARIDSSTQKRRAGIAVANGSGRRSVISCGPMSSSGPLTDMPMTTALELPGMRIRENLGVCYGLVVRSMGAIGGVAASFKALRRGEVSQ